MPVTSTIDEITWSRIHLTLGVRFGPDESTRPPGQDVSFRLSNGYDAVPVDAVPAGQGRYEIRLNIVTFRDRRPLPEGTWRVVPAVAGQPLEPCRWHPAGQEQQPVAGRRRLDDASRTFLYGDGPDAFVVAFDLSDDDPPALMLRVYRYTRRDRDGVTNPAARAKDAAQRQIPRLRAALANAWYRLARAVDPPRKNRVLLASEMRDSLGGNLARVAGRLAERGLDRTLDIRTSLRTPQRYTTLSTLRVIHRLAKADIVLIDDYFGLLTSLKLSPRTIVIQLWHAGSGFKSIGFSRFGRHGSPRLHNAHRAYTYAIAGSRNLIPTYAEAFGIEPAGIVATGLPRMDHFLDPAVTERAIAAVHRTIPETSDSRVVLFAPTFRGHGIRDAHYEASWIDFDALADACGPNVVILLRMHHFVANPVPIPARHAGRFIDVTDYPDAGGLLHVADLLITDYSSIIYEYSLLDRPMLFYAPDRDSYAASRGFHREYDAVAPGRVCSTANELAAAIRARDFEQHKVAEFRSHNIDFTDCGSADRVIDWLILGTPPDEARG